ncbi:DUF4159 domain-containing protein [Hyphococcus flavus]|uniref:DUF4159 domain-containing protein n=1 Tax=Hyphococcus flavus TaxID=1866326 RepID=A0AAE9ZGJ0_9PROT|nr:DUF4159 domain-containing protein [Hyphococcus flavus]WDI30441.1 DUF4159 domain-containing protein [Hyphococcus flavus]
MFGALSFTSPLILTALAALPVIWLLLRATPPAPKQERFPAFIILRQLKTSEETPDRTPWWLLLMRLVLTALIILGLSGPVLNAPAPSERNGPIVLIVDDTWPASQQWSLRRDVMRATAAEAGQSGRQIFLAPTAPQTSPPEIEPMTGEALREAEATIAPKAFTADREGALQTIKNLDRYFSESTSPEIRWLSDGVATEGDADFANALAAIGDLVVYVDATAPKYILRRSDDTNSTLKFNVNRLKPGLESEIELIAIARDGRELGRASSTLAADDVEIETIIDIPLALINDLASVRIANVSSAGTLYLADARDRRSLIGLVAQPESRANNLLSGNHYIRQALDQHAAFLEGGIRELVESDASVIILDDVGRLRANEEEALISWIERGGVLIRFAGPVLAEAAQDRTPQLTPVELRGGGRAFGGALTWDTPQRLDAFVPDSPFAGLDAPSDVLVRRQVLAEPGGETTLRTWARLEDGTPLVTGERQGAGAVALFHVTATPEWSDLPISGLFVEMLKRLTFLSSLGPDSIEEGANRLYAPYRLLDGEGRLVRPDETAKALTEAELAMLPTPVREPGFYGAPDSPLALNAVGPQTEFKPLSLPGKTILPYEATPPLSLTPPIILAALLLLVVDGVLALVMSGKLSLRPIAAVVIFSAISTIMFMPYAASAQPLDPDVDPVAIDAALSTRLAYVITDDPAIDQLSEQGIAALSRELVRRTAIEPAPPAAINLDTDDLSVYSFLYWPIAPGAEPPSDEALVNIENFMRFGGLLLIDTRDDERSVGAGTTPEGEALQRILSELNIPPLTPLDHDHVLARSFYLLDTLPGRMNNNPVWVEADSTGSNDGVTALIIGGRDWAGAWATDNFGRPARPMGAGGPRAREMAYRAGVNIVMVAYTGNYKSDQVHTPILLERLGQ